MQKCYVSTEGYDATVSSDNIPKGCSKSKDGHTIFNTNKDSGSFCFYVSFVRVSVVDCDGPVCLHDQHVQVDCDVPRASHIVESAEVTLFKIVLNDRKGCKTIYPNRARVTK
mgnify:CR=1 FL=1